MSLRQWPNGRRSRRLRVLLAVPVISGAAVVGVQAGVAEPTPSGAPPRLTLAGTSAVPLVAETVAASPTVRSVERAARPTSGPGSATARSGRTKTSTKSKSSSKTSKRTSTSDRKDAGSRIDQVVSLTNAERRSHGCSPLGVNSKLTKSAQAHSEDMAERDFFSHTNPDGASPFDRISATGYLYRMAAENIAAGYRTPSQVVDGWMNSPSHRANIVNCGLTEIGVGYATGGSMGTYWTQNFGTPTS